MAFINNDTSDTSVLGDHQIKQDNRPAIEQKYTSDEMEAAYALLALSNSGPNAPPAHKTVDSTKPGPNVYSARDAAERKLPPITPEPLHQALVLNTVTQVSPLAELNCFAAATVTGGEQRYVYNHYNSCHYDWTEVKCENHGLWACEQCFHAVNP